MSSRVIGRHLLALQNLLLDASQGSLWQNGCVQVIHCQVLGVGLDGQVQAPIKPAFQQTDAAKAALVKKIGLIHEHRLDCGIGKACWKVRMTSRNARQSSGSSARYRARWTGSMRRAMLAAPRQ